MFSSEDYSTVVGKATYLATNQIKDITTGSMETAYLNPGTQYHYHTVTFLSG